MLQAVIDSAAIDRAPVAQAEIVVTAARTPEERVESAATVTVVDQQRIKRLGEPLVPALLRLVPSSSVAVSGPAGSLTEVRIRGAEANHSLLFVDGIRANDPAAGNTPRFELLNADIASRIEVVRGPQSAIWGSEAIGGVIAVEGDPGDVPFFSAGAEAGSFGFRRASVSAAAASGPAALALAAGWQRATGIDSFGGGDRDGYRNASARARASWRFSPLVDLTVSGFALTGRSEFDGNDPVTFARTHDLDSKNRLIAGRAAVRAGSATSDWSGYVGGSLLASANRNFFEGERINETEARRAAINAQVERRFTSGGVAHKLIAAFDHVPEQFETRDTVYGGLTTQDRRRQHQALTVEWRAEAGPFVGDVALRRDRFSRFKDATSLRVSGLANIGAGLTIAASYGEGIAQPTFFDLFGFFPGNFAGNSSLRPESSRGVEASIRYSNGPLRAALTGHRQRLKDEIVDVSVPGTNLFSTANRTSDSRRHGLEAEVEWTMGEQLRLSGTYAYLRATEPGALDDAQVREIRRPRHSGSVALDGAQGRLSYGASIAYTGARKDRNFDVFPAQPVGLGSYWLGGARLAYAVNDRFELFARAANAFDQRYQDVFGYRTEGRSLYAGIRLADRR